MGRILTFVCIFLLLAVPAGSIFFLSSGISQYSDDVTITETTVFGDPSAAAGITVDLWSEFWGESYWNTRVSAGDTIKTETTFYPSSPFEEDSEYYYKKMPEFGITIRDSIGYDYGDEILPGTQNGINDAFDALAEEILPGESKEKKISLDDYMEHYALQVEITIPSDSYLGYDEILATSRVIEDEKAAAVWMSELEPDSDQYIAQQFQKFFQIPVLDTEKIKIGLDKSPSGEITDVSYGNAESEIAALWSRCNVVTEDAIYFTFQGHGSAGTLLDFSQVRGGYGIYMLPYNKTDGVKADQLSMVYPLNPEIEILAMELNTDRTALLLHTSEDGIYVMTVINLQTMEMRQRIEVLKVTEASSWRSWYGGNFLVVQYGENLMVFSVNNDGVYSLDFTAQLPEPSDGWRWPEDEDVMIYDGKRLAAAGPLKGTNTNHDTFCLTIYTRQGIAYHGTYHTGFNPVSADSYRWYCNLIYEDPLTISWN